MHNCIELHLNNIGTNKNVRCLHFLPAAKYWQKMGENGNFIKKSSQNETDCERESKQIFSNRFQAGTKFNEPLLIDLNFRHNIFFVAVQITQHGYMYLSFVWYQILFCSFINGFNQNFGESIGEFAVVAIFSAIINWTFAFQWALLSFQLI